MLCLFRTFRCKLLGDQAFLLLLLLQTGNLFLLHLAGQLFLTQAFFVRIMVIRAVITGNDTIQAAQGLWAGNPIRKKAGHGLEAGNTVDGSAIEKAIHRICTEAVDGSKAALQFTDEIAGITKFERDIDGKEHAGPCR